MRSITSLALAAMLLGATLPAAAQISLPPTAPAEPLPPQPEPPRAADPAEPAEPPAAAPAATAGLVGSVNLASLKSFAESQGAQAEIAQDGGLSYIKANVGGNLLFLVPQDCKDGDPNGECGVVILASGTWGTKIGLSKLMEFQRQPLYSAVVTVPSGLPMLRYVYYVRPGVANGYLENVYKRFNQEMQAFAQWASGGKVGAFSSEGNAETLFANPGLVLLGDPAQVK